MRPPAFLEKATSGDSIDRNLGALEKYAATVRRVPGNEEYDAKGVRTLWHRGRMIELLTWEDKAGGIVKQELSFVGHVVEFKNNILRTGRLPQTDDSAPGVQVSQLVKLDAALSLTTLEYASHVLLNIKDRDFYTQHLLRWVNIGLSSMGDERTVVAPEQFDRASAVATAIKRRATKSQHVGPVGLGAPKRTGMKALGIVATVGAFAALAGVIAFLVWIVS